VDTNRGRAIRVFWDGRDKVLGKLALPNRNSLKVLPMTWKSKKGVAGHLSDMVGGMSVIYDKAKNLFNTMLGTKQRNLAVMMSDSVSKWIVCPIDSDADYEQLDLNLGVEDSAFQDFRKEAYSRWTGFKAEIPGKKCGPADGLAPDFKTSAVCSISELHADHVERYANESFICPIKPPLQSDQQLEILKDEHKDACFLRMTHVQAAKGKWKYNGAFPARKQHERMENMPAKEYELIKLLRVPQDLPNSMLGSKVSFARFCALEEHLANPRFCEQSKVWEDWPSLDEMAQHLLGTVAGSFGVAGSALRGTISTYQKGLKNGSKEALQKLSEKTLDGLFGTGRLLSRAADYHMTYLADDLPGKSRHARTLEHRLFSEMESGSLLHRLSFQRALGNSRRTSNAKDQFDRFVVRHDCSRFDPAMLFSQRREWGSIARRLVKAAQDQFGHYEHVLDGREFEIHLRGEAYLEESNRNTKTENPLTWHYDAALRVPTVKNGSRLPADITDIYCQCDRGPVRFGDFALGPCNTCMDDKRCVVQPRKTFSDCVPKAVAKSNAWVIAWDSRLKDVVGGMTVMSDVKKLKGIKMKLYCGPKSSFPKQGSAPPSVVPEALLQCLEEGVETNAYLRAKEPWKLYFPEEVIVVAIFEPIEGSECQPVNAGTGSNSAEEVVRELCQAGASRSERLRQHHKDGFPAHFANDGKRKQRFRGVRTGSGMPKGAPKEVLLHPEDILEALGNGHLPPADAGHLPGGLLEGASIDISSRSSRERSEPLF